MTWLKENWKSLLFSLAVIFVIFFLISLVVDYVPGEQADSDTTYPSDPYLWAP